VVNRATRWIGLIVMTTLLAGSVAAEDLPLPDPDGLDLPQDSMLYSDEPMATGDSSPGYGPSQSVDESGEPSVLVPSSQSMQPGTEMPMEPGAQLDGSYEGQPQPYVGQPYEGGMPEGGPYPMGPQGYGGDMPPDCYYPWDGQPAPIESSGTWLNRGVWYAEADVVAFYRIWQRPDVLLAAEDPNITSPQFLTSGIPLSTNRALFLKAAQPGEDAGVRATLGRFLFRDDQNRDHTLEFTAFSAGNWTQDIQLSSAAPNSLFVSFAVDGGNTGFNQSTQQRVIYTSQLNSFELNYRLKKRLGRDQLVMDPNGHWRRAAANGFNRNYLAGFRFIQLKERLNWTAEDIVNNGDNGQYLIDTDNSLFGFQLGEGIEFESGRWSAGISAKMGLFVNNAEATSQLNFTADDTNDFNRHSTTDELSWLGEAQILGRYHVTPNCSLRAGVDFMVIDSLALAPRQINFINDFTQIEAGADPYYIGASLGFECYW